MTSYRFSPDKRLIFSKQLSQFNWLVHATSTRLFNAVDENRAAEIRRLAHSLDVKPDHIAFGKQTHNDRIALINDESSLNKKETFTCFPSTDSLLTSRPGIMINIFTADCLPIFIIDNRQKIIGLVHAGWKGTLKRILQKVINRFLELGSELHNLQLWIGPAIAGCCYEIRPSLMKRFSAEFAPFEGFYHQGRLNLVQLNALQAEEMGVKKAHISLAGLCTACHNDLFFSYRADGKSTGRLISSMMIMPVTCEAK